LPLPLPTRHPHSPALHSPAAARFSGLNRSLPRGEGEAT
jgi:hypothetical protein